VTPVRTTTRRKTTTRRTTTTRRRCSRLEMELLRSITRLSNAASDFLCAQIERQKAPDVACRRCLKQTQPKNISAEGFCPACLTQTLMDRRIQARLLPKVRTVRGMPLLGNDWELEPRKAFGC
jgi:hypothetical protein